MAILIIVAGHCWGTSGWIPSTVTGKLFVNLINGGTILFVFISGFLFHHIFYQNFTYRSFMIKKVKNVLCPYIAISIIPILAFVFLMHNGPYPEYFFSSRKGIFHQYINPLILYILTGRTIFAYWYIPFIMIIFALSPMFIKYIHLTFYKKIAIMLVSFSISAIIHRPIFNISVLQSVVYFTPVYLLGITASMYRNNIYSALAGKEIFLFLIILILALIQVIIYNNFIVLSKDPFKFTIIDINIIQKSILCIFFMVWLHRFEQIKIPLLNKIAEASFAIYFIHSIILTIVKHAIEASLHINSTVLTYTCKFVCVPSGLLIFFPATVAICYITALCIKKMTNSYSRYLIGW